MNPIAPLLAEVGTETHLAAGTIQLSEQDGHKKARKGSAKPTAATKEIRDHGWSGME